MKLVIYSKDARRDMERHANVAARIDRALQEYAAGAGAHANQVKALKGSPARRLRVGDFRVVFAETATEITVTRIAPRGSVYD